MKILQMLLNSILLDKSYICPMKIFNQISACQNLEKPVLSLGMYDGVHLGHQEIIQKLNQLAEKVGGESVLLTFEPHPRIALNKNAEDLQLLTTLDEKVELLEKAGLQNLILHPFTPSFADLSAYDFVRNLLVDEIGIHSIVIGYDHQFGKNRSGNFEQLSQWAKELNFDCLKIEEIQCDGLQTSSTKIRKALLTGDLAFANQALGRNYSLTGKVVHGDQLGRTLGFPTANLSIEKYKLIPQNGVYVVKAHLGNEVFKGLLSIGTRPTVTNSNEKRVEVFLLDFDREIYGENLKVECLHKIRDDQKFDSLEALVEQMNRDKAFAMSYFTS